MAVAQDGEAVIDTIYLSDFTWIPPKPLNGIKLFYTRPSNRTEIVEHDLSINQVRSLTLQGDQWEFLCLVRTEARSDGVDSISGFGVGGCNSRSDSVSVVGIVWQFRAITADIYENDSGSGIVEMGKLLEDGKNEHLQIQYRPYSTPLDEHFYDSQSIASDLATSAVTGVREFGQVIPVCRHFDFHMGDLSEIGGVTLIRSYTAPLDVAKYHMWHVTERPTFEESFQVILEIFLFDRNWKTLANPVSSALPCRRAIYLEDGQILIEANEQLVLLDVWKRTAAIVAKDAEEPIAVRVVN